MNKIFRLLVSGVCTFNLSICLASEPIKLSSSFNEEEIKWVAEKGNSSIYGSAHIKLENGVTKGCASFNVELLPVASYSSERIFKTYGNNVSGQILVSQNPPKFEPDVKKYHELVISTTCNAKNQFEFNNIPQGDFYILAFIIWDEEKDGVAKKLGGAVMTKIHVKENSKMKVNL
ncbi:MAG: hypothetical protein KKB00_03815 [Gammaproteobacteria bacterium]|nr:hypothetical protein [Gammaproteobacteria bacterium]